MTMCGISQKSPSFFYKKICKKITPTWSCQKRIIKKPHPVQVIKIKNRRKSYHAWSENDALAQASNTKLCLAVGSHTEMSDTVSGKYTLYLAYHSHSKFTTNILYTSSCIVASLRWKWVNGNIHTFIHPHFVLTHHSHRK